MSKLKSPFWSLGARGSVGGIITAQERPGQQFIRTKPIPAYRYTLPQAYQRWLYEDYAYLWRQQSQATQREYAAAGSRYHLTGFQYWMKYQLTNLPDIAGWWRLDTHTGASILDSSRNLNHGTRFGPSDTLGPIDGALDFDGINDYVSIPSHSSLELSAEFSIEFFCHTDVFLPDWRCMFAKSDVQNRNQTSFMVTWKGRRIYFSIGSWTNEQTLIVTPGLSIDTIYHCLAILSPTHLMFYRDGGNLHTLPRTITPYTSNAPIRFGRQTTTNWHNGLIDNVILYNRALDETEAIRHSLRRYPP